VLMVALFVFGDVLPIRIGPPPVAIVGATLALMVVYGARAETIDDVLHAVDWKTLVFIGSIMTMMQGFTKTGLLQGLALVLNDSFGPHYTSVGLVMLAGIGVLSSVLANLPVVAASVIMAKGYLVAAQAVPDLALGPDFTDWPAATLPLFVGMMFGGTLGGNATMIGASSNVVSVNICARHGQRVTFAQFMRFGVPITLAQLAVGAVYVVALAAALR
jgi:Na+/H+ antiporter NhaD/arsenite permease-like protein